LTRSSGGGCSSLELSEYGYVSLLNMHIDPMFGSCSRYTNVVRCSIEPRGASAHGVEVECLCCMVRGCVGERGQEEVVSRVTLEYAGDDGKNGTLLD
jgi:hypothetical protein